MDSATSVDSAGSGQRQRMRWYHRLMPRLSGSRRRRHGPASSNDVEAGETAAQPGQPMNDLSHKGRTQARKPTHAAKKRPARAQSVTGVSTVTSRSSASTSRSRKKTYADLTGRDMERAFLRGCRIHNRDAIPRPGARFNLFFYALRARWRVLVLAGLFAYAVSAAAFAAFFLAADCVRVDELDRAFFVSLSELLGGATFSDAFPDTYREKSQCALLSTVNSALSLVLTALIFGLAVRKFMKAKTELVPSRYVCVNKRDNVPILQFRLANYRGNYLSDVSVHANWARVKTSTTGERYFALDNLDFEGPPHLALPINFTHVLDASSPMYEELQKTGAQLAGLLVLQIRGYDTTLDASVFSSKIYKFPAEIRFGHRFADVVKVGPPEAAMRGTYMEADFAQLDNTVPIELDSNDQFLRRLSAEHANAFDNLHVANKQSILITPDAVPESDEESEDGNLGRDSSMTRHDDGLGNRSGGPDINGGASRDLASPEFGWSRDQGQGGETDVDTAVGNLTLPGGVVELEHLQERR